MADTDNIVILPNTTADCTIEMNCMGNTNINLNEHGSAVIPRRSSLIKNSSRRQTNEDVNTNANCTLEKKKSVSFGSMPHDKNIMTDINHCFKQMQSGCKLIKVRANSRHYNRIFQLNDSLNEIFWWPSKKPLKARILISDIKEVRHGKNTDVFRCESTDNYQEACSFSIVYGENFETIDLVACSPDDAFVWITGLVRLMSLSSGNNQVKEGTRENWLEEEFKKNCNQDGFLDIDVAAQLIVDLNSLVPDYKVKLKLNEYRNRRSQFGCRTSIDCTDFIKMFKEISTRPEIFFLLARYSNNVIDALSVEDLAIFLENEQGFLDNNDRQYCKDIIEQYELNEEYRRQGYLGIDGFTAYLLADERTELFNPIENSVNQDMTQPLSYYYISTSHNTFLLEDQLRGPSSIEAYATVLKKGCRCIDLQCWDGPNDEPIIYNGHTLTSKIKFIDVINIICDVAFIKSDYPLIIRIENHCSVNQQNVMATILKDILQDYLQVIDYNDANLVLPSPEDLKQKILIYGNKLENETNTDGNTTDEDETIINGEIRTTPSNKKVSQFILSKQFSDLVSFNRKSNINFTRNSESLSSKTLRQSIYQISSFSESTALQISTSQSSDLIVDYNKKCLSRIFPNEKRIDSSNFNPQDMWNYGYQLVALNYQTAGLMMDLNNGKFLQNGNCGYVLKPAIMREREDLSISNRRFTGITPAEILRIRIISGQHLPKPKKTLAKGSSVIDPYVQVDIFGIESDCGQQKITKTVSENDNPIFDELFEFHVNLPEMALIRFTVLDDESIGDEFIGQYTIPFLCMQKTGYRHIKLYSRNGEILPQSSLFIHVSASLFLGNNCVLGHNNYLTSNGGNITNSMALITPLRGRHKENGFFSKLKRIGVKCLDEDIFKLGNKTLRESTNLRDGVNSALVAFRNQCALNSNCNVKQCTMQLFKTVLSYESIESVTLVLSGSENKFPVVKSWGRNLIPEVLKKRVSAFDLFVEKCQIFLDNYDKCLHDIENMKDSAMNMNQQQLQMVLTQKGFKVKKSRKAIQKFIWNIRLLQGQEDLLKQCKENCLDYRKQILDASKLLHITIINDDYRNISNNNQLVENNPALLSQNNGAS